MWCYHQQRNYLKSLQENKFVTAKTSIVCLDSYREHLTTASVDLSVGFCNILFGDRTVMLSNSLLSKIPLIGYV
jgi:hypothetical protein